jgi:hypothetical protein
MHDRRCAAARFRAVFHDKGHRQGEGFASRRPTHSFARQCGETATIDSALGNGTTVALYLPRASVQAAAIAHVLGSLQTRIYDSVGNLRNANDRTTYGPAAALKPTQ